MRGLPSRMLSVPFGAAGENAVRRARGSVAMRCSKPSSGAGQFDENRLVAVLGTTRSPASSARAHKRARRPGCADDALAHVILAQPKQRPVRPPASVDRWELGEGLGRDRAGTVGALDLAVARLERRAVRFSAREQESHHSTSLSPDSVWSRSKTASRGGLRHRCLKWKDLGRVRCS